MQRIRDLLGQEVDLDTCNRAVRELAQTERPAAVGAIHVLCSDECERPAMESFQRWVSDALLPDLKHSLRSAFRSANLGARYEWGAARVAEEHFAIPGHGDDVKVLIAKISSHVALSGSEKEPCFGTLNRYHSPSSCCGALGALLAGARRPSIDEIRECFSYDDIPRLGMLHDPDTIAPALKSLIAAVVHARLQARAAMVDIQDYLPATPTISLVLATVTVNRPQQDTEFVVGLYRADSRQGLGSGEYIGLGDDPSQYIFSNTGGRARIRDQQTNELRPARDHRALIGDQLRKHFASIDTDLHLSKNMANVARTGRLDTLESARQTLETMLSVAADAAPVPFAMLLFARGMAGIHHLYRLHHLARGTAGGDTARAIIREVSDQITEIPLNPICETIEAIRVSPLARCS